MSSALHGHNKEMMIKIGKNERKELYNHLKFLMLRGEQRNGESIKLRTETGLFVTEEDSVVLEN